MEAKKLAYLDVLKKTFNNITQASKVIGISRQTHYDWLNNDPEYRQAYESEEFNEQLCDMVEGKLIEQAISGNTAVLIFMAKTKLKSRGYVEKHEIDYRQVPVIWKEEKYEANEKAE